MCPHWQRHCKNTACLHNEASDIHPIRSVRCVASTSSANYACVFGSNIMPLAYRAENFRVCFVQVQILLLRMTRISGCLLFLNLLKLSISVATETEAPTPAPSFQSDVVTLSSTVLSNSTSLTTQSASCPPGREFRESSCMPALPDQSWDAAVLRLLMSWDAAALQAELLHPVPKCCNWTAEYLFYGLSNGAGPACYSTCYFCTVGTWNPSTATSCFTTCQHGCCQSCNSITGGQTNSNGAMTLGADRFSDTCNCGPGFYFEQSNDQWSNAQYSNTGAKDYLLPCQPCADGTFKSTSDLQDDSACTSCYDIDHASAKLDDGDKSYEDHTSFPVRSTSTMIMLCMCTYLHVTTPSLPWFQQFMTLVYQHVQSSLLGQNCYAF